MVVSDYLSVVNGVKQGAVLSVEELSLVLRVHRRLVTAGIGCHIGQHFVNAVAYAVDIVLIAPSPQHYA